MTFPPFALLRLQGASRIRACCSVAAILRLLNCARLAFQFEDTCFLLMKFLVCVRKWLKKGCPCRCSRQPHSTRKMENPSCFVQIVNYLAGTSETTSLPDAMSASYSFTFATISAERFGFFSGMPTPLFATLKTRVWPPGNLPFMVILQTS